MYISVHLVLGLQPPALLISLKILNRLDSFFCVLTSFVKVNFA